MNGWAVIDLSLSMWKFWSKNILSTIKMNYDELKAIAEADDTHSTNMYVTCTMFKYIW